VDLLFHHYNREVFDQLIESSLGRYSMYIVMNIDEHNVAPVLNKIDSNKLLLLDMGTPKNEKKNFLLQNFNESLVDCLEEGVDRLKKYKQMVLVYNRQSTPHPEVIVTAVKDFCSIHSLGFKRITKIVAGELEKDSVYFVIRDTDLVEVIKNCRSHHYQLGKDIGVLSYNDTPMKEIVGGGITVISTDFREMGRKAALFVKNKQKITKVLATSFILRESI